MKEIKDHTKRWKDIPSSWIGKISIFKVTILLKAIFRFSEIPMKLMAFFTELDQKKFIICVEAQKTMNSQSSPEQERQLAELGSQTSDYSTKLQ